MTNRFAAALLSLFCAAAFAAGNEIVVLKGGKTLELAKPYVVRGSQALMTLKDGTLISVAVADIDRAATNAARRTKPAAETRVVVLSPAEAAKAQQANPKAKVKISDADVGHVLDTGEVQPAEAEAAAAAEEAGAKLEVVDFDQRPTGNVVAVKGTLRNSGKAVAENIALTVSAVDATGKVTATTNAVVAAGSLESGSTATFTASIPSAVRASTLRFQPRWSGPVGMAKTPAPAGTPPNANPPATPAPAAPKPAAPPPPPAENQPAYKAQPDYAPPPANAPMTAPDDNHTGYIPGAHQETPPPPPPPPPPA